MIEPIEFVAVIKQVSLKALISGDKSARIILETDDLKVADLGKWPGDETVSVRIERNPK